MRTQWTSKENRDAGSSCSCDRGLRWYLRNFGGVLNTPNPPSRYSTAYCCSFGKWELYCMLSTRNLRNVFVSWNISFFTTWSTVLLEKLTGSQLVKKFPAFYATHRFNTSFSSACRLSLSWDNSMQQLLASVCMSIDPSTCNNSAPAWWIFIFDFWEFFEKLLRKFNFH